MLDPLRSRQQFPALRARPNAIFFDGAAGTQVPDSVVHAIVAYLTYSNANHGGLFATSKLSDEKLDAAHQAVADLLNAPSADEIVFGANMTTLTLHLSRSLAKTWQPGDEILVTRLDHDANVSPWVLAARDAGATIKHVEINPADCTLSLEDLQSKLSPRTKLLAVTCASNAVGTVNDVAQLTRLAHAVGAKVFLDAVHYTPHGLIDVQAWGCDFLACSAYKFFGPHIGILWGRRQLLTSLPVYKLRPAPESLPGRWMTGTQNHECLVGVHAAIDYLTSLAPSGNSRREKLVSAFAQIRAYELLLTEKLLACLAARPRFRVWGITAKDALAQRVPTVSITCVDRTPQQVAEHLAQAEIYAWQGNFYALPLTERLDLEKQGGLVRLSLVHYNTVEEIARLGQVLDALP